MRDLLATVERIAAERFQFRYLLVNLGDGYRACFGVPQDLRKVATLPSFGDAESALRDLISTLRFVA